MFKAKDDSVVLSGLSSRTWAGILIAEDVYKAWGLSLVITSARDGHHMEGSLHYTGDAFDCRIWEVPKDLLPAFVAHLQHCLGKDYDVVWHPVTHNTHIHVEYDPK